MRRFVSFLIVFALRAGSAAAVSPHEIVEMKKVGVSDAVLLAIIDRDQTIFTLDAKDLVDLQREGLSERVILAMLRSGREQRTDATAPATTAVAPPAAMPAVADAGGFAIVGHDPDYPGGGVSAYTTGAMLYTAPYFYGPGYYGMVSPFFLPGVRQHHPHSRANAARPLPALPSGPFLNDPMRRFVTPIVTIPQTRPTRRGR